ncbi:MAG: hypothetical protein LC794_08520 [Acidobacteria bacterium]|nr:hypothetical protein [Acidobacteriota bacterium]
MSWWDSGENDDVIGDQPADLVRHSLQDIASRRKPKLEELLRAIAAVAKSEAGQKMLENVPADTVHVTAKLKSDETFSVRAPSDDPADDNLVAALTDNLSSLQKQYQEYIERNPRLSEWLSVFAFVLRYKPEEFLEDGAARPVADLKASAR